jgi:hypothetical protein
MIGVFMIQRRAEEPFPMAQQFEHLLYDAIDD